ncbi:transposase [Marinobacter sediminicola]|uniref:transposase n=1 Tax=Marinobacter sediminicola TaxID=3072994 RepID=UPI003F492396
MTPVTNVGGNIATINEVSDDQKATFFSPEFKQKTASLLLDRGYTIPRASVPLEIGESAIRRWVNQLSEKRDGVTLNGKEFTPERYRIHELEARYKPLEQEKDIQNRLPLS